MSVRLVLVLFCNVIQASLDGDEPFHQVTGLSFYEYNQRCDETTNCLSVSYLRRFNLCKLYDVLLDESIKQPGMQVKRKTKKNITECSGTCVKEMCSVPRVAGADRFGNMYSMGSKVKFTCREIDKSEIITCLPRGVWSNNTLFCKCRNPGKLVNGQFGPLVRLNESHVFLNASCDEHYFLHKFGDILCEIDTGLWHGLNDFCCDKLRSKNWTKIFSSPKGFHLSIVNLMSGKEEIVEINTCTTGFYRNKTILSDWKRQNIRKINLTVISSNEVVAYMLFSGETTTNMSWFSNNKLINSSWSDLTPETSVAKFSINGMNLENRRWFVAKTADQNADNATCTQDTGWFVVTWNYYPCGDKFRKGHRILYAKNGRSSTFTQGSIGIADKFEIWIKQ